MCKVRTSKLSRYNVSLDNWLSRYSCLSAISLSYACELDNYKE